MYVQNKHEYLESPKFLGDPNECERDEKSKTKTPKNNHL